MSAEGSSTEVKVPRADNAGTKGTGFGDDTVDHAEAQIRTSWLWWLGIGFGLIVVVGLGLLVALRLDESGGSDAGEIVAVETSIGQEKVNYDFVIPFGTAARIAAGENINIVPDRLDVKVGDTMRVRNEDAKAAQVGFFRVNPGETVTMRFTTPGRFEDKCDVRARDNQLFIIDVSP